MPSKIEYNTNGAIHGRCAGLDWCNNHKEEVAEEAINKNNNNETPKQKTRQIRNEK